MNRILKYVSDKACLYNKDLNIACVLYFGLFYSILKYLLLKAQNILTILFSQYLQLFVQNCVSDAVILRLLTSDL